MRVVNKSTILGTTLVALAILNFSVLDQIGVGLVDTVNAKFEDLGAEWLGLQIVRAGVDPAALASELDSIPGVKATVAFWSTTIATPGAAAAGAVQWVMTSDSYNLQADPFLFVFQEESETQAKLYRDGITWVEGTPPGPGQVGVSTDFADENGLVVADIVSQAFGGSPFNPAGAYQANFTISGIYLRSYTDPAGNPPEIVLVGADADLQAAAAGGFGRIASRNITLVQAALPDILRVSDAVVDRAESLGHNVSTEQFQIGGRTFGGRQGGPGGFQGGGPPAGGFQGPGGGQGFTPPDMILFANGGVLASALDAAERAGLWFRMLTTSAVVLAVLGIAFVTAAMERKVRRDVGIRQAVGYPMNRIYAHWATVAVTMGLAGSAIGISLVYAMSALGLSNLLLGLDLAFRSSLGVLVAPIASVLVYGLATLPTYAKVLRSTPVENLRALSE